MDFLAGIVRIVSNKQIGTGFMVSKDGLIVTCAHVLGTAMPEKATLVFQATGQQREATVIADWWRSIEAEDVAFLQVDGPLPEGVQALPLGSSEGTNGHTICTFGYPAAGEVEGVQGAGHTLGLGAQTKGGQPLLQLRSSEITAGFSGAPVWDELRHRVVGMVVIAAEPDAFGKLGETAFATPTETLRAICPALQMSEICPYRNLEAFTEQDAAFFFGRQRVINQLVSSLHKERRFLAVFGPSGSGKSSVVQAGLLPRLREGAVPGSDRWRLLVTRPTDRAFQDCLNPPAQALPLPTALVIDQFEELFVNLADTARQEALTLLTRRLEGSSDLTLIVVMRDEFYSHFVQHETFAQWIQRGLVNILPTLTHEEVAAIVCQPATLAGWRFEDGLIETIVQDVLETNAAAEDAERVGASTILPLLEFALTQLWERRADGMLTHEAYKKIGGVTGGLTQWADHAFYGFEERLRPLVRHVFTALVHLGNEEQHIPDTRRRLELTSLARTEAELADVSRVVQQLAAVRLLVLSQDPESKKEMVELIHDALLREWGLLKQWLAEDRRFLAWHQKLEERLQEWVATDIDRPAKRDKYKLVGGRDLAAAEEWLTARKTDLSQQEQVFIEASKKRQQREVNRLRFFVTALSIFSVVVIILALVVQVSFLRAERATKEAQTQRDIAQTQANNARFQALVANAGYSRSQNQIDQALLLSEMAYQAKQNYQSRDSLLSDLEYSPQIATMLRSDISSICDYCALVSDLAFSPDGRTLIDASWHWSLKNGDGISSGGRALASKLVGSISSAPSLPYGGITLWDMKTKQPHNLLLAPIKYPSGVGRVAFSPDGQTFASAGSEGGVQLWDTKTGAILAQLAQTSGDIAFSPDGKFLAVTVGEGLIHKSILLYDLAARKFVGPPVASQMDGIYQITFSPPTGKLLAVEGWKGGEDQIEFWGLTAGKLTGPLGSPIIASRTDTPSRAEVLDVKFSPDGKLLATGNVNGTITLWDVASKKLVGPPLSGHRGLVNSIAFNSSGSILASGGEDKTVRLWDVATRTPIGDPLIGHRAAITRVAWSSKGQLASGDDTETIILWDVGTTSRLSRIVQEGLQDKARLLSAAFSPVGKLLASGDLDGKIILRDSETMTEVGTLAVPADTAPPQEASRVSLAVDRLVFSPDGRVLASSSANGTMVLWDVKTKQVIVALRRPETLLAFSPDSHILAIAGIKGGIITLWDLITQKDIKQFTGDPKAYITRIAFSPDGRILASFDYSGTIILWDIATGRPIGHPLTSEGGQLVDMSFNPKENTIAGITENGAITLWDTTTMKPISQFYAADGVGLYSGVEFSPNGKMLAVVGTDADFNTTISVRVMTTSELLAHPFRFPYDQYISMVMFSPDGHQLASVGLGGLGRIIVSDIDLESWQARGCSIANRNFTAEEWRQYGNGQPYDKICPDLPVPESQTKEELVRAQSAAKAGDRRTASRAYTQATQWATETSNPILNNYVCWYGSLDQFAKEVMPACEQAITLEPDNGIYHDSRGVARALQGDYRGAIEDFQSFVTWTTENKLYSDKPYIAERNAWIDELKTGRNPFDAKTLEALRDE